MQSVLSFKRHIKNGLKILAKDVIVMPVHMVCVYVGVHATALLESGDTFVGSALSFHLDMASAD